MNKWDTQVKKGRETLLWRIGGMDNGWKFRNANKGKIQEWRL